MFNLSNIPIHVNDIIFDETSDVTQGLPATELPEWVRVAWFFAWTIGPGAIIWQKYRRLAP